MSSNERLVAVDTPSCPELRDLASLHRDFDVARSYLLRYLEAPASDKTAEADTEALWQAAIVKYGRAFGNGVRHKARPSLGIYDAGQRAAHDYVMNLRNKFIAHSVNAFEEATTWAILTYRAPGAKPSIRNVGVRQSALAILAEDKAALIAELCDLQIQDLKSRMKPVIDRVFDECRQVGGRKLEAGLDLADAEFDQARVMRPRA